MQDRCWHLIILPRPELNKDYQRKLENVVLSSRFGYTFFTVSRILHI